MKGAKQPENYDAAANFLDSEGVDYQVQSGGVGWDFCLKI